MPEALRLIGEGWWALAFVAAVWVVAGISNAGLLRTVVHVARPASASGAFLTGATILVPFLGIAVYRGILIETGHAYPAIMYVSILVSLCLGGLGTYLIFAERPPRVFIPRWLRTAIDERDREVLAERFTHHRQTRDAAIDDLADLL